MNRNAKSYKRQTLECYLTIFVVFVVFFGTFIIAGQLNGMNWIYYIGRLAKQLNITILAYLV